MQKLFYRMYVISNIMFIYEIPAFLRFLSHRLVLHSDCFRLRLLVICYETQSEFDCKQITTTNLLYSIYFQNNNFPVHTSIAPIMFAAPGTDIMIYGKQLSGISKNQIAKFSYHHSTKQGKPPQMLNSESLVNSEQSASIPPLVKSFYFSIEEILT